MAIIKPNNNTLSSITALPTGLGGKVLQVVTANDDTTRSTTSTSYVTASNTLSVDITPSATSSKVFVLVTTYGYANADNELSVTIKRDSTDIGDSGGKGFISNFNGSVAGGFGIPMSLLDSPSSTSQITYQVFFKVSGGTGYLMNGGAKSTITVFEIGA